MNTREATKTDYLGPLWVQELTGTAVALVICVGLVIGASSFLEDANRSQEVRQDVVQTNDSRYSEDASKRGEEADASGEDFLTSMR